jgi:hypothetical protein
MAVSQKPTQNEWFKPRDARAHGFGLGEMHPGIEPWLCYPEDSTLQKEFAEGWAAGQEWYQEKQDACDK